MWMLSLGISQVFWSNQSQVKTKTGQQKLARITVMLKKEGEIKAKIISRD